MKVFDLNDEDSWLNAAIYVAPTNIDAAGYQSRIDAICGKAYNGWSNIRLIWSASPQDAYKREFCEWDAGGNGTKTHLRSRYQFDSYEDETAGIIIDIPVPRWGLEQFMHPAQYAGSEDAGRWSVSENGSGQKIVKELRPRHSTEGIYIPFMTIAKHTNCAPYHKKGLVCWGEYREPDESYITLLARAVTLRDANSDQRPDEPITMKTLREAALETVASQQKQKELADAEMSEFMDENILPMMEKITGQSFTDQLPAWSLPANTKKRNGIITLN